jgi:hypothetical protein
MLDSEVAEGRLEGDATRVKRESAPIDTVVLRALED